jgi:uncharacterized membrane protein YsdA (DUF1294 family)
VESLTYILRSFPKGQKMLWKNPVRFHLTIALGLCALGTATSWWFFTKHEHNVRSWLANWLLVVNVVTFAYYGLDKFLAIRVLWRVPEIVLHVLSAIGGSPAAFLAMWIFRHKTIKTSFRILFWSIVLVQAALVVYIVKLQWWD